ncbi:MAG: DUF1566 domain-containing protein [Bacteroidales bacterium]|nr:DUF1566 domain-containing protein [Bacteroidales bacterium]
MLVVCLTGCKKYTEPLLPTLTTPLLTTTAASSITQTTATSGGNITSDGGATVTARGVCWNTSANPTIANSKTTDGTGIGAFISSITELTRNTTYYIRAYATNSVGTSYGNEISFKTATVSIGDSYQGGKVAYILQPGDPGYVEGETHGLIAATSDQGTNIVWSSAVKLCYDLVLNGYSDWYLPSIDELNKLYINRAAIGVFSTMSYWSSTELDRNYAYAASYFHGTRYWPKSFPLWVRAVRAF